MIETGKNAPTGAGKYIFNTRLDQNKTIYDLLDMHVMELAGLKQVCHFMLSQGHLRHVFVMTLCVLATC